MAKWATVTVQSSDGRRHSVDVLATSVYDAAHLWVVEAKGDRRSMLPHPTLAMEFEVVTGGRIYHVSGEALQRWILQKRQTWNGPKGYMFTKRPTIE